MCNGLVSLRLFSLERTLCLTRESMAGIPAALIIPWGGRIHDPYLMLLGCPLGAGPLPGPMEFADTHAVADGDGPADRRRTVADVLVTSRPAEALDRHPGCSVAIGPSGEGHLALRRAGPAVEIACSAGASARPAFYGSMLYGWTAAGFPVAELASSAIIVGAYAGALAITEKATVRVLAGQDAA